METPESLDTLISMVARPEEFEEKQYSSRGIHEKMEEMTGDEEEMRCQEMKKRRLSVQQVRSLEKNFEVENKLEPDRKTQLAKELGLQPRQVAVWFQNRRARWKTKQLERDYGVLKLNYDALKSTFDAMHRENQKLTAELSSVRKRVEDAAKRKGNVCERDEDSNVETKPGIRAVAMKQEDYEEEEDGGGLVEGKVMNGVIVFNERLEGSESDSSAILNDNGGGGAGENNSPHTIDSYICTTSSLKYGASYNMQPSAIHNDIDNKSDGEGLMEALRAGNTSSAVEYNPQQCFRIDEPEESCNLFNVDDSAAATLPWWEWP